MNSILKSVQREIELLKQANDSSGDSIIKLTLIFDRSEADMMELPGFNAFEDALAELGGERTEKNIQKACERSCFSRGSVYYLGDEHPKDRCLKIRCSKQQERQFKNSEKGNSIFYID